MTNPECPGFESHEANAYDQYFAEVPFADRPATITRDQDEAIMAIAEAEYLGCEGH